MQAFIVDPGDVFDDGELELGPGAPDRYELGLEVPDPEPVGASGAEVAADQLGAAVGRRVGVVVRQGRPRRLAPWIPGISHQPRHAASADLLALAPQSDRGAPRYRSSLRPAWVELGGEKADADFGMSLARRSPSTSPRRAFSSSRSAVLSRSLRTPASASALRTHLRRVSWWTPRSRATWAIGGLSRRPSGHRDQAAHRGFLLSWHGWVVPLSQVGILVSGSPSNLAWLSHLGTVHPGSSAHHTPAQSRFVARRPTQHSGIGWDRTSGSVHDPQSMHQPLP